VNQLLSDFFAKRLAINVRLLVIIGNPVAVMQQKRFIDVNMNRLFSGEWQRFQGIEAERAEKIERYVRQFFMAAPSSHLKLHYDLHTAIRGSEFEKFVVYPYVAPAVYQQQQLAFLAAAGIQAVLLSHQPTTTFSYFTHQHFGAQAFTVELGQVQPLGQNDLQHFSAMAQALRHLLSQGQLVAAPLESLHFFAVVTALTKEAEDYQLHIDAQVKNFTRFEKDVCLASSAQGQYRIECAGDAIIFPNANVPIGQRAGLVVRNVALETLSLV
jgi:succinylglutamate desuccinylase